MKKSILLLGPILCLVACGSSPNKGGAASTGGSSGGASGASSGGASSSSSGGAGASVTRAQFFADFVALVCPSIASECATDGYTYSLANCTAGLATFDDPGANADFNAAAATTCLASKPATIAGPTGVDASCHAVWVGKLAPGADCTKDAECKVAAGKDNGAMCDTFDAAPTSFCVSEPGDLPSGSDCNQIPSVAAPTQGFCADGFSCGDTCQPLVTTLHEACDDDTHGDCGPGLYCSDGDPGTCETLIGKDGPCTASNTCADGFYCSSGNTCVARLADLSPCDPADPAGCGVESYCSVTTNLCENFNSMADGTTCENQEDFF